MLIILLAVFVSCSQENGVSCTVYFNPNGGTGDVPHEMTGESGTSIKLPDPGDLAKEHFTFSGWNTSMAGTGRNFDPGEDYDITFSTTLYANWQPQKFLLCFDSNGAEGKPADRAVDYGTSITMPDPSTMSYPHMDFIGWSDGNEIYGQGIAYQILDNTTLVAQWEDHLYTVTFDANGGKVTAEPVRAYFGDSVSLPAALFREHFVLQGWSLTQAGDRISSPFIVPGDVTLYAVWLPEEE